MEVGFTSMRKLGTFNLKVKDSGSRWGHDCSVKMDVAVRWPLSREEASVGKTWLPKPGFPAL